MIIYLQNSLPTGFSGGRERGIGGEGEEEEEPVGSLLAKKPGGTHLESGQACSTIRFG